MGTEALEAIVTHESALLTHRLGERELPYGGGNTWTCTCGASKHVWGERWQAERSWRLHRSACEAWAARRAKVLAALEEKE